MTGFSKIPRSSSMALEAQKESKCLVVIPDGGLSWYLWCIDFIYIFSKFQKIVVLDLRQFSLRRKNNRLTSFLRGVHRKNTVDKLIKRISEWDSVEYVKTRDVELTHFASTKYHLLYSNSFKNGLDSEYFEEAGERVLNESQLSTKTILKAKQVYDAVSEVTSQLIITRGINRLIIPGGRTLIPAACITIAKSLGIQATILESNNGGGFGYSEYPTNFRSNTDFLKSEIDRKWNEGDSSKYSIARKYLEDKLKGENTDGSNFSHSFDVIYNLQNQKVDRTAVIFVTSGFEFESFVDSHIPGEVGRDHQKAMVQIFCQIAKQAGYNLILRGHPPRQGRELLFATEDPEWDNFCVKNEITFLPSNSRVDSQHLMKQSSLNVVYASSAAIESILLGSQTIILGNAEFANLLPELCAFDEHEIRVRLSSLNRETKLEQIYPYAYFMSAHGTEISDLTVSNQGDVIYKGKHIDAPRFKTLTKFLGRN